MSRYLAIDHGSKRIGLALSDPMKIIAKPYKTITYNIHCVKDRATTEKN